MEFPAMATYVIWVCFFSPYVRKAEVSIPKALPSHCFRDRPATSAVDLPFYIAEGVGFEPTGAVTPRRFSLQPYVTISPFSTGCCLEYVITILKSLQVEPYINRVSLFLNFVYPTATSHT